MTITTYSLSRGLVPLLGALLVGCEPDSNSMSKSAPEEVETDTGNIRNIGEDQPIDIRADAPAFYSADGVVTVTGHIIDDGSVGDIQVLTIGDTEATFTSGRSFKGTVTLDPTIPFQIVHIHVEDDRREGTIQVQVARATEVTSPARTDALGLLAGPEALDQLALHLQTFIRDENLAPPEGAILRRTCEPIYEPSVESGLITEELRLTGEASLKSLGAAVQTDDEALHLDLQNTRIEWGAEVVSTLDGTTFRRPYTLFLDLQHADDLPDTPCPTATFAVSRAPEPVAWSDAYEVQPSCFTAAEAGAAAAPLYAGTVPPELDRASCAWADWLDTALVPELSGVTTVRTAAIDRAGITMAFETTAIDTPPVETPVAMEAPSGDGLTGALATGVIGPILQSAAALDRVDIGSGEDGSAEVAWIRLPPVEQVTTLVANDAGTPAVLPVPVGLRIEKDGVMCAEGHVILAPVALLVDDRAEGTHLAIEPVIAGADVENICQLSDSTWELLLEEVGRSAFADHGTVYRPADGVQLLGGTSDATVNGDDVTVTVGIPAP